jgi:hypothetical protein
MVVEVRDGGRVLPVTLVTDIGDEAFLEVFREAVLGVWARSPAAREAAFRVELEIERVAPEMLYPEGVPDPDTVLEDGEHLARFPEGAVVLTTGAASTHAWAGRSIHLGTDPLRPRTLAHEFGHLLGFTDAYLRSFEGDPADPYGVVLVEWGGIRNDLMGDPGRGPLTVQMIERLCGASAAEGAK